MTMRHGSPGQALLRKSKVFAIPQPLKTSASSGVSHGTSAYGSNTATSPHPTHLTITTPPSSLSRGDWGLKRSLPLRATRRTTTPIVRVKAMDTYEHITEFGSGADHALNLDKFLEMGIPLTTPAIKESGVLGRVLQPGRGVFERDVDVTQKSGNKELDDQRWKFQGPWLAGQTEGEFNEYMLKTVRSRKVAFRAYLREAYAADINKKARRRALEEAAKGGSQESLSGEAPANLPDPIKASDITDEQLTKYLRELRHERNALFAHIRSFLDLPPAPPRSKDQDLFFVDMNDLNLAESRLPTLSATREPNNIASTPYAESGPPKSHPSAGLSYLRTKSIMDNHPTFGPQDQASPVTARIIQPKNAGNVGVKLGLGGFVTNLPPGSFNSSHLRHSGKQGRDIIPGSLNVDPTLEGGAKLDVAPSKAVLDSEGRIIINVERASDTSVAARDGNMSFFNASSSRYNRSYTPQERQPAYGTRQGSSALGYGMGDGRRDLFGNRASAKERSAWDEPYKRKPAVSDEDKASTLATLQDMIRDQ